MSEPPIDQTGHLGGEIEMLTLAQENKALRIKVKILEKMYEELTDYEERVEMEMYDHDDRWHDGFYAPILYC